MSYEELLEKAEKNNVTVLESVNFNSKANGLINGDVIGLSDKLATSPQKACTLAEEMGHYFKTTGNIISQSKVPNRKQERISRLWAFNEMIGLAGIVDGYKRRCASRYELAEFLGVTEEFLQDAINYYRAKYGVYVEYEGYRILFEPSLAVTDMYWMKE